MKVNIRAVPDTGLVLAGDITPQELGLSTNEYDAEGQCDFELHVRRLGASFHVRGQVRVTIKQTCARCLADTSRTVTPEFQMLFQPASEAPAGMERQIRARDLGVSFFTGHEIDLGPEVRQAVRAALPLKPLCSTECKGLCPKCGEDLNIGACTCTPDSSAPVGGTLADLMKKWGNGRRAR